MNESTIGKPAVTSPVKDPKMRAPGGVRCLAFCAFLVFANLPDLAFSQSSCPGIHVKVLNIRNSTGTIDCALFDSPVGFPIEALLSATNVMVIKVRKTDARCDFEDIPPGTYAMAVIHDENMNGSWTLIFWGSQRKGTVFQTRQRPGSVRHRFLPPVSSMTAEPSI